jgi:hypothetical protein
MFYGDPPPPGMPERLVELSERMLWENAAAFARMSPRGTAQRVAESGHYVPIDRADAVIRAVRGVVESLRGA